MLIAGSYVFQETIHFEIPTPSERSFMFRGIADQLHLSEDIDIESLSAKLHSYKMADIYMLLRLADELRYMRGAENSKRIVLFRYTYAMILSLNFSIRGGYYSIYEKCQSYR